jgi:3,4-dihydroxy-2-butanone 4-phosphate synthase
MADTLKLHDVVALTQDIPARGLRRGDVGTVVEVFELTGRHPAGFIVEFVDESGAVYAQADITDAAQLLRLHFNFRREAA